jgi:hypothetical protein
MSEQELFGLALGGTLILVIVVVILAVAIAAILKSRERKLSSCVANAREIFQFMPVSFEPR